MYQVLEIRQSERGFERASRAGVQTRRRAWACLGTLDRSLLQLTEQGISHRDIARMVGLSSGAVTRRLNAVQHRLDSPGVTFLLDSNCPLPPETRRVAIMHLVTGLSFREISRSLGVARETVAARVQYARGLIRGLCAHAGT